MTSPERQPVVECNRLTKTFKDFWGRSKVLAVDQLDIEIQPGEVFGLLGPNGSGKSTTIKILLGLLYPTTGRARVFGRPPTDTAIKARVGFMPEESYLYRFLNARETLHFYGRLFNLDRTERRRRTDQLIEMVGLKKAARRVVGQYSKGMARRIGLAQALINDPDLLILDEPTTGLDPIGSRQIKDVILELKKRGKTVLLCSHLLADVEDVCDRAAVMYGGRLQAMGPIRELLARQEVTQIRSELLDEAAIGRVRRAIEQDSGRRVLAVEHPTDRLEDFFLRVVTEAQRERLATSGAESGRGVTEFLSASPPAAKDVLAGLVRGDDEQARERPAAADRPAASAPAAPAPDVRRIQSLIQEQQPVAQGDAAAAQAGPAAAESADAPDAHGPRSLKPAASVDRSVLERLTGDENRRA